MMTIDEIRRERLGQLVRELDDGRQSDFARRIRKDRRMVSLWLARPPRPGKRIGDAVAREIEATCRKPPGWMDHLDSPVVAAPVSQLATLDPGIMAQAEAMTQTVEKLRGSAMPPVERGVELVRWYRLIAEGGSLGPNELLRPAGSEGGQHGMQQGNRRVK